MLLNECIEIMSLGIFTGALLTVAPVMIGYGIEKAFNLLLRSTN